MFPEVDKLVFEKLGEKSEGFFHFYRDAENRFTILYFPAWVGIQNYIIHDSIVLCVDGCARISKGSESVVLKIQEADHIEETLYAIPARWLPSMNSVFLEDGSYRLEAGVNGARLVLLHVGR